MQKTGYFRFYKFITLTGIGNFMAVLVTGGAGYIGSHMVLALLDRGEDVVVIDSLITGFPEALPVGVPFFEGNVGDETLVRKVLRDHNVETIVHFAASLIVPESVHDPLGYYQNNTGNTRTLIASAVAENVRHFIFSSTASVYGTPKTNPVSETAPLSPESPYGSSKMMSEIILRDASRAHGLKHGILRYFNVAGADARMRAGQRTEGATHLIKVACEAVSGKRSSVSVFGTDYPTKDGTGVRDYIHVSDLISAHMVALDRLRGGEESFTANCGYGHGYSVLEVIEAVRRTSNTDFEVIMTDRRDGDPAEVVAQSELIRSFGWAPEHDDLGFIVRTALDWERRLAEEKPA